MKKIIFALLIIFTYINAQEATNESVTKLYVATFDRAPDADGLQYWVNTKAPLEDIASSFFEQDETKALYPDDYSNIDFINSIYMNLFKHSPDQDGLTYWQEKLDTNQISKSTFILAVVNGALGDDKAILDNKTAVGLVFAEGGFINLELAKISMQDITADPATSDEMIKVINDTLANLTVTFTDTITGLMWQDNEDTIKIRKPQVTEENLQAGNINDISGDTIFTYCENLNLNNFTDWRVPNTTELTSITDTTRRPAFIDGFIYIGDNLFHWSSEEDPNDVNNGITLGFDQTLEQGVGFFSFLKSSELYVRCVRGTSNL
jgi:hypothetical protein